ncbi:MAG: hypothetical protein AVDCRST_MAG24-545 [uncultured Nocardioidaceae bacterium]|uniref:Uncharacterized protein n=1 Tax=uncultured Nocardioidaceae bacterium TaxID=253824 RepID=A0A6J4L7W7_9ACTN|nr:MAG: hypothetical protein AVDCRST_MAG24-545 [uncultured Nocardioidaceae bacterium]
MRDAAEGASDVGAASEGLGVTLPDTPGDPLAPADSDATGGSVTGSASPGEHPAAPHVSTSAVTAAAVLTSGT